MVVLTIPTSFLRRFELSLLQRGGCAHDSHVYSQFLGAVLAARANYVVALLTILGGQVSGRAMYLSCGSLDTFLQCCRTVNVHMSATHGASV